MRRTLITLALLASAVPAGAVVSAQPAAAAVDTRLVITIRPQTGPARSAWLTCNPAAGSHRQAEAACAALAAAGGNPAKIVPDEGVCTMEYAPATAHVTGRWQARPVRYRATYSNLCMLRLAGGVVFRI